MFDTLPETLCSIYPFEFILFDSESRIFEVLGPSELGFMPHENE
jgi:hypothetical protein